MFHSNIPKISIGADILNELDKGLKKEWLLANGLGGYASSSVFCCNTRRYHGLLIAPGSPDPERLVLLSKLEESIVIGEKEYYLSTNKYRENHIHPGGYFHMRKFVLGPFPRFYYTVEDVEIVKEIFMIYGANTTVVRYRIFSASGRRFRFKIIPLLAFRKFHLLRKESQNFRTDYTFEDSVFTIRPYDDKPTLKLRAEGMKFKPRKNWYKNFAYDRERDRGLDYVEDLYSPGIFESDEVSELKLNFIATTENKVPENIKVEYCKTLDRMAGLIETAEASVDDIDEKILVLASDMHIIKTPTGDGGKRTSIIAGYHWFGDWGRDTFISLPGLTLCTGRFNDAKEILCSFAAQCRHGLIPNRFGDLGNEPTYNSVDASLWFINAVHHYVKFTGDLNFVKEHLYTVCKSIIESYEKGTDYNIFMDSDHLISAGAEGVQLTWMDAKVGDRVITPRHGKPVEVNALWYNALRIMVDLAFAFSDKESGTHYKELARKVRCAFNDKFPIQREDYLYDYLIDNQPDRSIRPNQLYAISLPYPVLNESSWEGVLKTVSEKLYTPVGIRSLDRDNPKYRGYYDGGVVERDTAYHNGTAWGFLLGAYIEAYLKINKFSSKSIRHAQFLMDLWMCNLTCAGVNTLSEIFDGDEPFAPKGCISQAWTVAEALRIKKLLKSPV